MNEKIANLIANQPTSITLEAYKMPLSEFQYIVRNCPQLIEVQIWSGINEWLDELVLLPSLKILKLDSLRFSQKGFSKLCELKNLVHLELNDCEKITSNFFSELVNLQNLETLNLLDCENIRDDDLKFISQLPNLSSLCLQRAEITSQGLQYLSSMKNLKSLVLIYCDVEDGMLKLHDLPSLEKLKLECCYVSGRGLQALSDFKNLKDLEISFQVDYGDNTALRHIANINKLEILKLDSLYQITRSGVEYLTRLNHLKTLILERPWCGQSGFKVLSKLKHLNSLTIRDAPLHDEGLSTWPAFKHLRCLEIGRCFWMTDAAIKYIASIPILESLSLFNNSGITEGCIPYLYTMKNLQYLNVFACDHLKHEQVDASKFQKTIQIT